MYQREVEQVPGCPAVRVRTGELSSSWYGSGRTGFEILLPGKAVISLLNVSVNALVETIGRYSLTYPAAANSTRILERYAIVS